MATVSNNLLIRKRRRCQKISAASYHGMAYGKRRRSGVRKRNGDG